MTNHPRLLEYHLLYRKTIPESGTGKNGGFQIKGDQVTPINVYRTSALQIPNKETSGDLGGGIYFNGNTSNLSNMSTRSDQVAVWGNQIFMEGGQVTLENSYMSTSLQVRNG